MTDRSSTGKVFVYLNCVELFAGIEETLQAVDDCIKQKQMEVCDLRNYMVVSLSSSTNNLFKSQMDTKLKSKYACL